MEASHEAIAKELLEMAAADQAMRTKAERKEAAWDAAMDEAHQHRLMQIVDMIGWPTISKVGSDASHAAWLLVQHAPKLAFMERCLGLMASLPPGEVWPSDVAFLQDRVLVGHNEPQLYGTQFHEVDGELQAFPIQDPTHVDERRAKMGLGGYQENEARIRQLYGL